MEEVVQHKKHSVTFEDNKVVYRADIDQDGEPSVELKIALKEIPAEAIAAWQDLKGDK